MDFTHTICRILHDEHHATIELLDGLEDLLARGRRGVPDLDSPAPRKVLGDLAAMTEQELKRHFAFEEQQLFTRLSDAGDGAIGEHLTQEHQTILPVAQRLGEMASEALETAWANSSGRSSAASGPNSSSACRRTSRRKRWRCCRCWKRLSSPKTTSPSPRPMAIRA
jgi:hypothetical protein